MKILSLDTTTFLGSMALVEDAALVAAIQQGTQVTYSERLINGVNYLLESAGWKIEQIELIAAAVGPGSFTGLRIGLGTAKGIAMALSIPMVGVSSLEVLAAGVLMNGKAAAIIDARRDQVYSAVYEIESGRISKIMMKESVFDPEDLARELCAIKEDLVLIGDGARRYRDLFEEKIGKHAVFPDDSFNFPHAGHLARLAREKFEKDGCDDLSEIAPNYIRKSDAEIGFMGRHDKRDNS